MIAQKDAVGGASHDDLVEAKNGINELGPERSD